MKRYWPGLVAAGMLLLSFQNCSEQSGKNHSSTNVLPQTKVQDPSLAQATHVDILTRDESQRISLDLRTGEMTQKSQVGAVDRKCLSESMRAQILDLMNNSDLCQFEEPGPAVACAMVYSAPYSEIHWPDKSIKVGEARSSCQKDIDLCGQDGKILRGLLRDVVTRWSEWSCDFKAL
jgi:hypothetical protein